MSVRQALRFDCAALRKKIAKDSFSRYEKFTIYESKLFILKLKLTKNHLKR